MTPTERVAIVTGGARGIGRAVAAAFLHDGAAVVIADVNAEELEGAASELARESRRVLAVEADVADATSVQRITEEAVRAFGRVDILVNNAAVAGGDSVLEMTEEHWQRVLAVNLTGPFLCAQAAARQMVTQDSGGVIINVSSISADRAYPLTAAYTAAKGGVRSLTMALARELGPRGIRVIAVAPSFVETEMARPYLADDRYRQKLAKTIPLGRIGRPEDVADVVVFLASDEARYITGSTVYIDGGLMVL